MLHSRRKRLEALAAEEAAGKSFWTDQFDEAARIKFIHGYRDSSARYFHESARLARGLILRDEGRIYLRAAHLDDVPDFLEYLVSCDSAMVPTVVEAMVLSVKAHQRNDPSMWQAPEKFETIVSIILREHRISYELIEGRMVEFTSQEMHQAVVGPTLRLLSGRQGFEGAERAYQEALEEISHGKPADAITDAGTALQEMLTALGCEGNALGPLTKSARKMGLLAPHDSPMAEAVEKLMHWVSADRSTTGDAHNSTSPNTEDAWLIVHLVGALVLRLASGLPR